MTKADALHLLSYVMTALVGFIVGYLSSLFKGQ